MGIRQAVISPFQAVALSGFLEALEQVGKPRPDLSGRAARGLIYSSLLQAGVSRLELSFPDDSEIPTEKYLSDRVVAHRGPEVAEVFIVVYHAFRTYIP